MTSPKQSYSRTILLFVILMAVGGGKLYAQCTNSCPVISNVNINSCVGVITISVTGDGPFTYVWEDSGGTVVGNSFVVSGLTADNYTVTITDADGDTETATYTVTNPPNLVGSVVVNDVTCRGDSDAQVVVTMNNGNPDYSWELFNGGGASIGTGTAPPFSTTINLNGLGVDNYTLTVTDDNGCTGDITFSVTEPADFLGYSITSSTDATCFNSTDGSITATGTGGWGNYVYQWIRVSDGVTVGNSATVNGLAPGDYQLVIVDRNGTGCTVTSPNVTIGSPPEIVPTAVISDAFCNGDANGAINLSVTGGVGPYTYSWSNGATSQDISGLAAGTYTVTITDNAGCTDISSYTVGEPAVLTISPNVTNVACFGDATGVIESNVSGGTAPYNYVWSNGATSADISSLSAGTYDLTVTDDNGCVTTLNNITVSEPAAALSKQSDSLTDPSCAGYNDGSITITMQGGTAPYSYSWSNGDNTATASNLTQGMHTVTVTDNNGCTFSETFTLTDPPSIVVTPALTEPSCNGAADGSITVSASNGTAPYVYNWNTGDSGPTINGLVAGTYTVTVTDQNGAGCTVVETITLGQPAVLNDNATVNDISCNGANDGSIFLAVTGGTGPYTYSWSNGATSNNISGLSAGPYSVTIEDNNGCTIVRNYNIVDPPAIGVTHTQVDILCRGALTGEIDITPSGGTAPYSYSWSNGSTTQDLVNVAAGSYTVRVTDDEGCFVDLTVTLTEPATVMNLSGVETDGTCAGSNNGSINLTVTGGTAPYTYLWNTGATSEDINSLAPGIYSVSVEDAGGCIKSIDFTIAEPSPISVSETLTNVSCNGAADGSISLAVGGGTGPYTYSWADDGSITTKDRTGLGPGNYTITVQDASGCLYVESFNITEPAVLSSTATQLNVSCFGESTGSIDLAISGGSTPYTFLWSNGALTEDLTNIPAGNYSVTITDANGCTDNQSFTITEPASALSVSSTVSQITCNGAADGVINLSVSGGSAPYSFNWSHGSTAEDLSNLSAGNYTVTVTDNNGCTYNESFTITDPPVLTLTDVVTNIDCNGADNGEINITVGGGEGPYTYAWSNGETTEDVSGLAPGNYSVTVTDARGCSINDSYTISQPTALGFSYTSDAVSCFGFSDGAIDITVTGGTAPYSYSWSNGEITEDISTLAAGDYTVTVTDFNGCSFNQTITVTQPAAPLSDTGVATDISCYGGSDGSIQLNPAGGTAPYTYAWSNGATTKDIFGLLDGNYQVTITDDNGCSITKTFTINMPPALLASGTQTNILCHGDATGAIDLTVSGGTTPYTYTWSNGANTQDLSNIVAGNYQVTISDASGCTLIRNFTITQPLALVVGENVQDVSCFGVSDGFIDLSVSGGIAPYTYAWSNGAITQDLFNISGGNYSVTITDGNGCVSTRNYTIAEPTSALSVAGIVTDEGCFGDNQGAIALTVTGGSAPYSYSWNHGPTTRDVAGLGRGVYQVTVTDNSGCSVTTNYTVSGPDDLRLSALPTQIDCHGAANGALDITVTGGAAPYTYSWSNSASTEDLSNLTPGNYSLTVTDNNGCTVSGSWTITQPLAISIGQTTTDVSCFGAADGAIDITVSGGISPYTYSWSNGATSQDLSGISGGSYTVTITDANGCISTGTYTVVEPSAALSVNGTISNEICFGDNQGAVNLTVTGGTAPYTYSWNNGATTKDIAGLGPGTYQVTITDAKGCFIQNDFTVSGPAALSATSLVSNVSCNGAGNGAINITPAGGTAPYTFSWSNGATTEDISSLSPGNYSVTITDNNGCTLNRNYTITQPNAIGITPSKNDVSCFGAGDGSISINVIGGTLPYTYSWSSGQNTKNISGLSGGSYTLTVTDGNACTSSVTVVIDEPTAALTASGVVSDETCFGDSQGAIDLTVTGGTAPYSYSWNHGSSAQDVTGLGRGTYQVTVTDAKGCSVVENFTVSGPDVLQASAVATQINCNGAANGALNVSVVGGTAPYTYSWSNGASTEDLNSLAPGNYNLTVTDASGCTTSGSWTITQPLAISVGEIITDVACFGNGDGSIDITVSGGIAPYTYSWSTGATSQDISGLSGGNYSVTITDANGCTSVRNYTVAEPTAALSVAGTVSDELCFGDTQGAISLNVSGGTAPYTYAWDHGPSAKDVSNLARGTYQVTVTDAEGCWETVSFDVGGPTQLQLSGITTQINCNGAANGAIDVTVTGGTAPYTYLWNNGATTEDISGLSPGNKSITVTDVNGCTISGSWTITQPLVLSVSRTITNVTCFGASDGAIDLTVSGGISPYTYSWSTGATTQDISGLSGGTYSVTITDANGCSSLKTYVVSEPSAALTVAGTVTDETCFGDNQGAIGLTVSGGTAPYSYSWNQGSSTKDISALGQGVYQVTVTDAKGCVVQSDFTVSGPTSLTATGTVTQISCNGAADGAIDIEVSGGTSPYTYAWGHGDTSEDLSALDPGNYSVVITDANGCSISRSYSISQPSALAISSSVTNVTCFGAGNGAINVTVAGGTLPYSYAWSNGANTRNISALSGGNYDLTVTDGNGCSLTQTITVIEPVAPLTLNASITDEKCFGDNQGAIDLAVTGGTAPYAYSWNNGSSSQDILGLGRGSYQVTVTDKNGCSAVASYTVSGPSVLTVSGAVSPVSCNGANDGVLNVTVAGGTAPFSYSWSNGATTKDISGLAPGTYALAITDANGCIANRTWTISEPLPLAINYLAEDVTCFGANDGSIELTMSGGTLPYTYAWSNGATTKDLSGLAGGTYEVVVTDAKGCQQSTQVLIKAPTAPLAASSTITDAFCNGQPTGKIQLNITGGTAPFSYSWSNGSNQRDLLNVFAGNYSVTIIDAKGCTITENYDIAEPAALNVNFDVTNSSCLGDADGAVSVTPLGGTAPYTYVWSNGSTSKDLANVAGGTYNLTITDANGCSITRSVEVGDSKDLSVDVQKLDVLCKGEDSGQIFLDITGGSGTYDISWDNGETSDRLSELKAGVYSASITDSNGCGTTVTVVISEPAEVLSVRLSGYDDLLCYGDKSGTVRAVPQGGVAPYTYLWSNGARTSQITGLAAGTYIVSVTDANGCLVQSQATIGQPDKPITISSQGKFNLSCKGDNDGRIVIDVEGGTGLYEFLWSTGATTTSISNLGVGDYTVRVKDGNGCVQERIFTISEPDELSIEEAQVNESQCYDDRNGSIELNLKGGVEPYSYQWSTGATTKNLIGITSGTYSVLVTDANGCQVQGNYYLDEPALFRIEPQVQDISCIGANDASISLNIEGGIEPLAIRWSNGASSETITDLGPGEYNVLVTDDKGCTLQQTFNIIEPLELSLDAYVEEAARCNDPRSGRVNVIVSGGTEPYTYRWSNGATTSEIVDVLPGTYVVRVRDRYNCEIQGTYTVLQPEPLQIGLSTEPYIDCNNRIAGTLVKANVKGGVGNYTYKWSKGGSVNSELLVTEPGRLTIEVFDDRGCTQRNSVSIDIPELGLADFNYTAESIDRTGDLASNDPVSFFDLSVGEVIDWHWDFGDGWDSNEIDPIHTYDAPGKYTVKLVVTDRTGCQTEKIKNLEITEGYRVIIPNAFTPNGDGNNDFFRPRMLGLVKSQLIIYNTWGEVIFSTDDIETKGWDGTIRGRKAENGNYVYKIIGLSFNGLKVEKEGIFALIN